MMTLRDRDVTRLGAGARRQIALEHLEQARREVMTVQAPSKRPSKTRRKYGNKPCTIDGHAFPSQAEGRRYVVLKNHAECGRISDLRLQPRYPLRIGGVHLCTYIGDFSYIDKRGQRIVEDVKGGAGKGRTPLLTPVFKLKRRLMKILLNIDVKVILS